MITYAERDNRIKQDDIILLKQIKTYIDNIDEFETPHFPEMTCHILVEAITRLFPVKHIIGYWNGGYEHSWCVTQNGNIIDVYPVGQVGGVILIAKEVIHKLYIESEILGGDTSSDKFNECVDSVVAQIKRCKYLMETFN